MYKLTKNGILKGDWLTREQCLIKLERARVNGILSGYSHTYKCNNSGALMTITNGDVWKMEREI